MENDKFLTTSEASKMLQVSMMTIHRLLKEKKLAHFRFGTAARIPESEILKFKEKSFIKADEKK